MFPVASSISEVLEAVQTLRTEKHRFLTLVVDSVTKFNVMVEAEVLDSDPRAKGLNQAHGGYGNAYDMVSKVHKDLRDACEGLRSERGMHVVFIAHAATETIDPPEGDPFSRYTIPMHKKSIVHYTNDVDVVAYIKQKIYTSGSVLRDEKTGSIKQAAKAIYSPERIITCYVTPSHVSKNRLGITTDLVFEKGVNPFDAWLKTSTMDKTNKEKAE